MNIDSFLLFGGIDNTIVLSSIQTIFLMAGLVLFGLSAARGWLIVARLLNVLVGIFMRFFSAVMSSTLPDALMCGLFMSGAVRLVF